LFVHQSFDKERVVGWTAPHVHIFYTDPDLRVGVAFSHDGKIEPVGAVDVADDIAARLKLALPDGFRPCDVAVVRRGAAADGGPLQFVPAQTETDGTGNASVSAAAAATSTESAAWAPPGELVLRYGAGGRSFCIHRWWPSSSLALQRYHDCMSTLAMWLIESTCPCACPVGLSCRGGMRRTWLSTLIVCRSCSLLACSCVAH
jgi:hypothetical protein